MNQSTRRSRISPPREAEILQTVIDLLREVGYEALTMDAVAARSRSGKATLYRQWQTKAHLVCSALRQRPATVLGELDTGSLRGDLHEMARRLVPHAVADSEILAGLSHAISVDEDLHEAVHQAMVTPADELMAELLARAAGRGEISAAPAAARFIPHMIIGALTARPIVDGRIADQRFLSDFIDAVVIPALRNTDATTPGN